MADFIAGYPSQVTVSGNNIIWAASDFDNIVFGKYDVGDYVANVSLGTPASQMIVAVPGLQADGTYIITVSDASGWTTGDRCTPQAQSAIHWNTSITATVASIATDDRMLIWYYSTQNNRTHYYYSNTLTKSFSIFGMSPDMHISGGRTDNTIAFVGDFSSQANKSIIENVRFGTASIGFYYNNTSTSGAGVRVTRCEFINCYTGVRIDSASGTANKGQVDNCMFDGCLGAIYGRYNYYYFNTITNSSTTFVLGLGCVIKNCIVHGNLFSQDSGYTITDCITNLLASNQTDNIVNFESLTELGFWSDGTRWNFVNPRIVETSIAYNAGSAITDAPDSTNLYIDFDGNERNETTPSIGFHEGTATAFPTGDVAVPTKPSITSVAATNGTITVTLVAERETDAIYVRYRPSGSTEWNTESGTYARVGSGTVEISGLTNGKAYQISAYAKAGYITSDWTTNCYAVPGIVRTIIDAAEEVKTLVADLALSQSITPSRVYIEETRLEKISGLEVWVQPIEQENSKATRGKDRNDYTVDIGIFKRCAKDSEVDSMVVLANEIYRGLRGHTYGSNQKTMEVNTPTIFSPDFLQEKNLFAAVISVKLMDMTP